MGWWWWKKQENSTEQDGDDSDVHKDILAAGRDACYKARDKFYTCMEKHCNSKPTETAYVGLLYPKECKAARVDFAKKCRPTWVKHFDRQYAAKKRLAQLLSPDGSPKGPISLPHTETSKPS